MAADRGLLLVVAQAFSGMLSLSLVDVLIFMGFVLSGRPSKSPESAGDAGGRGPGLTELFGVRLELASSFALLLGLLRL